MLIAVPPTACGFPAATSVLELEPLLAFVRQCRPDAVSLLPPVGADDLPAGAALAAMKERLEDEGLRVVPGCWEIPARAPVADEGWQAEAVFDGRALLAALGEAAAEPLVVRWLAPAETPAARAALVGCLERWGEEAERSRVRIALNGLAPMVARSVLRQLGSEWLGVCRDALPSGRPQEPGDSTLA